MSPLARLIALPVHAYRLVLSPWLGHNCRYDPTCSAYALDAIDLNGAWKGSWLALSRICRCHPWGSSGFDGQQVGRDHAVEDGDVIELHD